MGPTRRPETSVKDYHSTLLNTPEERPVNRKSFHSLEFYPLHPVLSVASYVAKRKHTQRILLVFEVQIIHRRFDLFQAVQAHLQGFEKTAFSVCYNDFTLSKSPDNKIF
jgi:hypothetical protein